MFDKVNIHLYVVEIIGVGVKVGVTERDPSIRIADHRRDAEAYGRQVGRTWASIPHARARYHEGCLKRLAGKNQRREYLPMSFDEVLPHAQQLVQGVLSDPSLPEPPTLAQVQSQVRKPDFRRRDPFAGFSLLDHFQYQLLNS